MTQIKNPSEQNYQYDNDNKGQNQKNPETNNDRSQEVDLPTPEKKNDDITTGINGEKPEENTGQTGLKQAPESQEGTQKEDKNKGRKTGFDPENTEGTERKDKRGDDTERLERDKTTDPKTKDADWQQDKMNEANNEPADNRQGTNQQGKQQNVDKASRINDTRDDSILDRPKTETYEKKQGENIGGTIKKDNYTHTADEKKRDDQNRRNTGAKEKQL